MNKNELRSRRVAWEIIKKSTYRDRRLSDVTAEIFRLEGNNINDHERRLITMLVQGTVRMSGRLDWEIRQVFVGEYEDLKVNLRILLRMGVFQLHYMDSIPDYAAVATTVQLAKRIHNNLGGLTNAILRTILKEKKKIEVDESTPISTLSEYFSHPEWLMSKWIKDHTFEKAKALAEWNNKFPKLWFRVNRLVYTPVKFKNYLKNSEIKFEQFEHIPEFITTSKNQEVIKSKIFIEGKISIQDPSAGLVVQLLDPQKKESIVDVCAAPGGKTSYIAEKQNDSGKILAFDSNQKRLSRLEENINRLNITSAEIDLRDITEDKINMTDKMLIDVPCTGTGVMSKRADIRWRRSIDEILEMHLLQRKILWTASKYINPGGVIIYSTCSVEPEENIMVIDAFLKSHPNYSIEPADKYVPKEYVNKKR